ncbi:hypothetical protein HY734_02580 [Candidatus Uhrbacteria bacterium]|nr:hypothetical protein [Candidatus Uhrbacteria bacterium]
MKYFGQGAEESSGGPEKRVTFEVMKTPDIVIQEERGAQLFSLLLKAQNPEWGETETPLARETADYFRSHPVEPSLLKTIGDFYQEGVDEETLYNLALTYQHPERAQNVLMMAAQYKPHVKDPEGKYHQFLAVLEVFDQAFSSSPLAEKFAVEIERDKMERQKRLGETRKRIETIIDFFKPDSKSTTTRKVSFIPDPLYRANAGRAFSAFPGEQMIISHVENVLNQDHEFSHGIINPIVHKLMERLDDGQKEKLSQMVSVKLKQDYGSGLYSPLCEEFIRTYTEIVARGGKPQTYEDFVRKISNTIEEQFQKFLAESKSLKARCDELGITTMDDFRDKSREYFERFEKNPLRDLMFEFYQEYLRRPDKDSENFEQFVLRRFSTKL